MFPSFILPNISSYLFNILVCFSTISCLLLFLANSIDLTVDLICNSYFSTSKSENPIARSLHGFPELQVRHGGASMYGQSPLNLA